MWQLKGNDMFNHSGPLLVGSFFERFLHQLLEKLQYGFVDEKSKGRWWHNSQQIRDNSFVQPPKTFISYSIFKGVPSVAVLEKSFLTWSLLLEVNSHTLKFVFESTSLWVYHEARTFLHYFCQLTYELLRISLYSPVTYNNDYQPRDKGYLKTRSDDLQYGPNNMYVNTITEHCRLRTFHENLVVWVYLQTSLIMRRQTNNSTILCCQIVHQA
jgi:hypothetical protein